MADFDDDLRKVLKMAGCKSEKISFILDESNILDSSFLERINTLLANGEVPGLFEGDDHAALMTACKEGKWIMVMVMVTVMVMIMVMVIIIIRGT